MTTMMHPSALLAPALVATLRAHAAEAEQLQQLHPVQLQLILEQAWFKLFVPARMGGLQYSLPDALQLEEALAWVDGSVGWTVTLCAGAGWFVGFIPEALSSYLIQQQAFCLAGSGIATGEASITNEGYVIKGDWPYATGAPHATAFTANCIITADGKPVPQQDGTPLVRAFVLMPHEVKILPNWKRMGMIATASNRFAVSDVMVPTERCFDIDPNKTVLRDAVYRFPFMPFATTTLAVNSSGMALRFIELCADITGNKPWAPTALLAEHSTLLQQSRTDFYNAVNKSWQLLEHGGELSTEHINHLNKLSKQLATVALQAVDALFTACGMEAANPDTELNRVWRNLHTASLHSIFNR